MHSRLSIKARRHNQENQNPTETTAEAVDSLVQEYFVRKAEAKGFKKGVIQHSLNTKWSEFADRSYYSYIKTLKSGMKLYRAEATNMMMEVYVLKDISKFSLPISYYMIRLVKH